MNPEFFFAGLSKAAYEYLTEQNVQPWARRSTPKSLARDERRKRWRSNALLGLVFFAGALVGGLAGRALGTSNNLRTRQR